MLNDLKTYEYILNYDSWHNNRKFVSDYHNEFGRNPYLPPSIANRWYVIYSLHCFYLMLCVGSLGKI